MNKRFPNPAEGFAPKYPLNRVTVTEGGHVIHHDDTPGKERIRVFHKSGSGRETIANGQVTDVVVAGLHHYVKGGITETVDGNVDEKVGGSHRQSVHGDTHQEVAGHVTMMVQGDSRSIVGGDHTSAVGGDHTMGVVGKMTVKLGAGMEIKGDATMDSKVDGATTMQFGSFANVYAKGDITITSDTQIKFVVGGSTITMKSGEIEIKSASVKFVKG